MVTLSRFMLCDAVCRVVGQQQGCIATNTAGLCSVSASAVLRQRLLLDVADNIFDVLVAMIYPKLEVCGKTGQRAEDSTKEEFSSSLK